MNSNSFKAEINAWLEVVSLASELQSQEPDLTGIEAEVCNLKDGLELSNTWLNNTKDALKSNAESIIEIAVKLEKIAVNNFNREHFDDARRIGMAALVLSNIALGLNHESTRKIAEAVRKLHQNPVRTTYAMPSFKKPE